jgi:enoyl-CoA hydratase/carnithine racemase
VSAPFELSFDGHVAELSLHRPERRNAMTQAEAAFRDKRKPVSRGQ